MQRAIRIEPGLALAHRGEPGDHHAHGGEERGTGDGTLLEKRGARKASGGPPARPEPGRSGRVGSLQ